MDKSERLFCLWKLMEKMAFRPAKDEIVEWLHCYGQFLDHFWQISDYPWYDIVKHNQKVDGLVHYGPLRLKYGFQLEFSLNKHAIYIEFDQCSLQYGYDVNYFNELDSCEKKWDLSGQMAKIINNITGGDIEKILEGKVAHPAIHQHIKYKDFPRWIRIDTSAKNPFLFLYQLAFQLCDCYHDFKVSAAKKEEFRRLKNLFFDHFKASSPKKGYFPISPGKFFNL